MYAGFRDARLVDLFWSYPDSAVYMPMIEGAYCDIMDAVFVRGVNTNVLKSVSVRPVAIGEASARPRKEKIYLFPAYRGTEWFLRVDAEGHVVNKGKGLGL